MDKIEPQPAGSKVTFSVDKQYSIPADARAAILSPSLVTSRAIQLVPVYSGGPKLSAGASIPLNRTAVPVEWDDFRKQLEKLTDALQPTSPGGVNSVGEFINSAADNVRGQGDTAHDTIIKLSEAISALGDHADDIFSTVRNLQLLVSALYSSSDLLASFNQNLASVTTLLTNTPNEVANAVKSVDGALTDLRDFLAENREAVGVTFDRLSFRHDRIERQSCRYQTDSAHRPDRLPEFPEHLPAGAERDDRHHRFEQLRRHSPVDLQRNRGGLPGPLEPSFEAVPAVPESQSSKTASTTTYRRGSTRSWALRPGRTKSPTARTGCDPAIRRHRRA